MKSRVVGRAGKPTFSPDGRFIAFGAEKRVTLYEVKSTEVALTIVDVECGGVVAFAPDGKTLAHTRKGGEIVLRETQKGRVLGLLRGYAYPPDHLTFSPDGKSLAAARLAGTGLSAIRVWDVAGRIERSALETSGGFHAIQFHDNAQAISDLHACLRARG